ncbi:MAG: Hsp20 family protein [Tagaea sp.]|nr:Hsp20 family protein [Tagaea sp.]
MTQFDFSPLFRSTVGFDRLSRLLDESLRGVEAPSYPPYNIEKTGQDSYRIVMAVAGFAESELELTQQENQLLIAGRKAETQTPATYLHRGLAARAFERRFQLDDFIRVAGATLENGLLHVDLVREVPEAMKPRRIAVGARAPAATLEAKAA